jgi:CRP-like cAMP-binding protein
MPSPREPQQNHLLAALSAAERERLYPHLQLVSMPLGKVLYESGDLLRHVYFPTDSIISLLYVMADGASAEISVVGNEGLIGIALFMGGETTPSRAVVQSAGSAYRLMGQYVSLAAAVSRSPVLQHVDHDPGAHRQHAGRAP